MCFDENAGAKKLTDSNNILTQLGSGFHKHGGQDLHGRLSKGGNKASTLVSVALGSTEALTCEDANTLLDGLWLLHKVGDPGHDGSAVVAGPVTEEALHLAKAKALTGVTSSDESRIEAVGHLPTIERKPPHKQQHQQPGGRLGRSGSRSAQRLTRQRSTWSEVQQQPGCTPHKWEQRRRRRWPRWRRATEPS